MDTKLFKTRTIIQSQTVNGQRAAIRKNPSRKPDQWVIGLDIGYSSVKGMSQNSLFTFPKFAKKLPKNAVTLAKPLDTDILYRDCETRDIYAVGEKAEKMLSIESASDNDPTLFGRNHYYSEIFKIVSRVGLGMAMQSNSFGSPVGKRLIVQTGLPSAYIFDDTKYIKEVFADHYNFDLKMGKDDWQHFEFDLTEKDIFVMQQPMGTLISLVCDRNGVQTLDSEALFKSKILVFDPGFKTGDTAYIKGGEINIADCQTFEELSMMEVLTRTANKIRSKYGVTVTIPAMQNYLETGEVKVFDRKNMRSYPVNFAELLEASSMEVCDMAISKLVEVYNYFSEVDYLTLSGGTGAAWYPYFKERLSGFETLNIIPCNRNDDISYIFSNVRGYYLYRINIG